MTMRVDAYTHFFPQKFFDKLNEVAGDHKDMGKRVRSLPALYDLDFRKKIVDGFKDYQQILSYPQPPIERFAKTPKDIDEFCRIINDGFAELIAKEKDRFPGWVAQVSLDAADAGVGEAERALKNGALGVQIYTNVAGKPLDRPEYRPFFTKMSALGIPIWLHPVRGAEVPDYISEQKSLYEIWWTFGWSYETATAMMRLVYSKIMDDHPDLKIILSHAGGFLPYASHRIAAAMVAEGGRSPVDILEDLRSFYFDTALSGSPAALPSLLAFAKPGHVLFGTDFPFAPPPAVGYFTGQLDAYAALDADAHAAVDRRSAEALFPQFSAGAR